MKSNDEQIKKFTKRPTRYWFEDGIGELVTGGLFGLIGVYLIIQQMVTSPIWIGIFSIFSVIVIGFGVILGRALIGKLKEQFVYPRTGYVTYPKRPSKRKLAITIGTAIAVIPILIILGSSDRNLNWIPIIIGAICGALMLFQAAQANIFRLYIEAALAPLAGTLIAFSGLEEAFGSGCFFLVYGAILIFGGGCALHNYFKNAPTPEKMEMES